MIEILAIFIAVMLGMICLVVTGFLFTLGVAIAIRLLAYLDGRQ